MTFASIVFFIYIILLSTLVSTTSIPKKRWQDYSRAINPLKHAWRTGIIFKKAQFHGPLLPFGRRHPYQSLFNVGPWIPSWMNPGLKLVGGMGMGMDGS